MVSQIKAPANAHAAVQMKLKEEKEAEKMKNMSKKAQVRKRIKDTKKLVKECAHLLCSH